jgi:hypothetical protein
VKHVDMFIFDCSCQCGETVPLNCSHQQTCLYGEPWWYDMDRRGRKTRRNTTSSDTLPTTNHIWAYPDANPGLRGERPATNCLSHGTAFRFDWKWTSVADTHETGAQIARYLSGRNMFQTKRGTFRRQNP